MEPILSKYVLTRINVKTKDKNFIMQGNERTDLLDLKKRIEAGLPLDMYNSFIYLIEEAYIPVLESGN